MRVGKWRRRFRAAGIGPARTAPVNPQTADDDKVAADHPLALQEKPDAATHWSTRIFGAEGIAKICLYSAGSPSSWSEAHLREDASTLSSHPFFIEKVRDTSGCCNTPDHAMSCACTRSAQIRRQSPRSRRCPPQVVLRRYTHDSRPERTRTTVIRRLGHRHWKAVKRTGRVPVACAFDREVPAESCDPPGHTTSTHNCWTSIAGGATPLPSALHAHLGVPGLNQVERWFGLLSQRAIKRGSFRSVADLVRKIQAFIDSYNTSATPFVWVATAQSILDKVARIAMRISGTAH